MTSPEPSKLAALERCLLSRIEDVFPPDSYVAGFSDKLEVRIPAKHAEVGGIRVHADDDEVTVYIGDHYHTHFEAYLDDSLPADEADAKAVEEAVVFIREFIDNKFVLQVTYAGDVPVASNVFSLDIRQVYPEQGTLSLRRFLHRMLGRKKVTKCYQWDGPRRQGESYSGAIHCSGFVMKSRDEYDRATVVVRDVIHAWDPYELIASGAPSDEWDSEIAAVVADVRKIKSPEDAANTLSRVFSAAFQPEGFGPADCEGAGRRLFQALRGAGIVTEET